MKLHVDLWKTILGKCTPYAQFCLARTSADLWSTYRERYAYEIHWLEVSKQVHGRLFELSAFQIDRSNGYGCTFWCENWNGRHWGNERFLMLQDDYWRCEMASTPDDYRREYKSFVTDQVSGSGMRMIYADTPQVGYLRPNHDRMPYYGNLVDASVHRKP